jgi:heptosyltransferase III
MTRDIRSMRKILVLRGGALGDFIVTLPALAALRARWPHARIELAGNATAAQLAGARGVIDAAHSQHEARWSELFRSGPLSESFARWLDEFDLVVNYWPDSDGRIGNRFPARGDQVFLTAPAMPAIAPAAAHYLAPLRQLGIESRQLWVPLAPIGTADLSSGPRLEPFRVHVRRSIAVHPGSGSPRKNWPLDRWADVCRHLTSSHRFELRIIGGEADEIASLAEFGPLARNLPLETLIATLHNCRLFLGHDSGVSHLAAACGVPAILLFGPTDPAMWAPPAPHVTVIRRGDSLTAIPVRDVVATIGTALSPL